VTSRPPVRFSTLKEMRLSPAHYRHALSRDWTADYLRKGTALHSYLLGGSEIVVYDGGVRRGREWEEFKAAHKGATILIPSEAADVAGMRRSIEENDNAMRLLDGIRERTIHWTTNGRECRGTPDVVHPESVVELKTAKTTNPEWFVRDAHKLAYHGALAWYSDGLRAAGLADPSSAFIVAVESKPPYPTVVFELTRTALEVGKRLYKLWWERLMVCEAVEHWPGYSDSIVPFDSDFVDGDLVIDGNEMSLEEMGL
jgi:hypothetical protein